MGSVRDHRKPSLADRLGSLLDPRCVVNLTSMQNQLGRMPLAVGDESDLRIPELVEKVIIAFGEYFD